MTITQLSPPFRNVVDNAGVSARDFYVHEKAPDGAETADARMLRSYLQNAGLKSDGPLREVVIAFQRMHNASLWNGGGVELKLDGQAGPKTLEALRQCLEARVTRGVQARRVSTGRHRSGYERGALSG